MNPAPRGSQVLVLEDDLDIQDLVAAILERAGMTAHRAGDGAAGLREFFDLRPDLVILDISMPERDGWTVLERIREMSEVPILILTARSAELDKVRALRAGADDYVVKPFGREELLARVEALLRRAPIDSEGELPSLHDELLEIDFARRAVRIDGGELELTPTEFKLITAFARHPGQVLDAGQLLALAWGGPAAASDDQVKLYVSYLRRKLREAADVEPISTVRGFGYRYDPS
jgi:DNA-binding response OmpR family regulator